MNKKINYLLYVEIIMNKLKSLTAVAATITLLSSISFSSHAMDKYIEGALIDVCKSTLENSIGKYRRVSQSYNLKTKTVAMKVMCNGEDIIDFAQRYGSNKTAAYLEKSMSGQVSIIDVAKVEKLNVNFSL